MGNASNTYDENTSRAQLLAEIDELRLRVSQLNDLEERCLRAEAALQAVEDRSLLWRESAPMGVCTVDAQGVVTGINRKMRQMLSLPPCARVGCLSPAEIMESSIGNMIRHCLENKESLIFEQDHMDFNTVTERLRFSLSPVCDAHGVVVGAMAFGENITELNLAQQAIRESEKRFRLLFKSAPIAMMERDVSELKAYLDKLRASGVTDFKKYVELNPSEVIRCMAMIKTLSCNAAFLNLMEVSNEMAMRNGLEVALFENAGTMAQEILAILAEGALTNEKERVFTTLKGNKKTVLAKTLILSDPEGTFSRVIVAMLDISQRKQAEEALRANEQKFREQAMHDGLTGLYNRRYLYDSLEMLITSGSANQSPVSVIFMDIDHFKEVVDTHGHLNGSRVIRELASTISGALETPAYAVAYAGDEFVAVLPGFRDTQAIQKALEIQQRIKQSVYLRDQGIEVRLQASFGIATFPDQAKDVRGLLGAADHALFAVKKNGRNAVRLYGHVPDSAIITPETEKR